MEIGRKAGEDPTTTGKKARSATSNEIQVHTYFIVVECSWWAMCFVLHPLFRISFGYLKWGRFVGFYGHDTLPLVFMQYLIPYKKSETRFTTVLRIPSRWLHELWGEAALVAAPVWVVLNYEDFPSLKIITECIKTSSGRGPPSLASALVIGIVVVKGIRWNWGLRTIIYYILWKMIIK